VVGAAQDRRPADADKGGGPESSDLAVPQQQPRKDQTLDRDPIVGQGRDGFCHGELGRVRLVYGVHTDSLRVSFGPWSDRRHGLDSSENPSPENVAAVAIELSPAELERLSAVAPQGAAVGDRYADMSTVNR
jgi:hypothetical protein